MKKMVCVAVLALLATDCLAGCSGSDASGQAEEIEFHIERGDARYDLGDYADAIAEYDRAVRIEPGFALAYYMRGNAKAMLGRTEGAFAHMKHELALAQAAGNADLVAHMERELRKLERAQGRTGVCCSSILTPAG